MPRNLLAEAAGYLQRKMSDHAALDVVYRRSGREPFTVRAIAGQIVTETEDLSGMVIRTVTRDFTISQVELAAGLGEDRRPRKNDEISYRINGQTHRYIVNADGFSVSHYDESDAYGEAYRIHTRRDAIT